MGFVAQEGRQQALQGQAFRRDSHAHASRMGGRWQGWRPSLFVRELQEGGKLREEKKAFSKTSWGADRRQDGCGRRSLWQGGGGGSLGLRVVDAAGKGQ